MDRLDDYILSFLRHTAGVSESVLSWVYPLTALFAIGLVSYLCTALFRYVVMPAVQKLTERTKATWDDYLFNDRVMKAFRRIIPPVLWYVLLPFAFAADSSVLPVLLKACNIYLVVVSLFFISEFLHSLYEISSEHQKLRNRPLKGIYQMFNLMAVVVGFILVVSIIVNKSAGTVLAGLGASAAIIMLIFKDTILGLVAGVQLTANDMLRPGDWITMNKYGANGYVREVSLTTVKVQNFDKTITTIPPYLLVSDSFQNWRGMQESGGRRVNKNIFLDMTTLKFCTPEMLDNIRKEVPLMADYQPAEEEVPTNAQLYRIYIERYLCSLPVVNQEMDLIISQKEPTTYGVPIQVYFFSRNKVWKEYERIQSDIFDHLLVMVQKFDLKLYQYSD